MVCEGVLESAVTVVAVVVALIACGWSIISLCSCEDGGRGDNISTKR